MKAVRPRAGWSLLEMVAVIALMGILLAMVIATLAGTIRTEKAGAAAFHKAVTENALIDHFRADVATARSMPAKFEEIAKSATCLLLERADGSLVIYRLANNKLSRVEVSGTGKREQPLPLGDKHVTVEFSATGPPHPLVTMRLKSRSGVPLDTTAALGGDSQ